jgi:hypothetical protein
MKNDLHRIFIRSFTPSYILLIFSLYTTTTTTMTIKMKKRMRKYGKYTQLSRRNVVEKLEWSGKFFILFLVSKHQLRDDHESLPISTSTIHNAVNAFCTLTLSCLSAVGKLFSISFFIFLLPSLSPHTHFKIVD